MKLSEDFKLLFGAKVARRVQFILQMKLSPFNYETLMRSDFEYVLFVQFFMEYQKGSANHSNCFRIRLIKIFVETVKM